MSLPTIKERAVSVAEKIYCLVADGVPRDADSIAELIEQEFGQGWGVIIATAGGIAGDYVTGDRKYCEEAKARLELLIEESREAVEKDAGTTGVQPRRIRFDPMGMGYGAPCPVDAITRILVLGPTDKVPKDISEPAAECAVKFHAAWDKARES